MRSTEALNSPLRNHELKLAVRLSVIFPLPNEAQPPAKTNISLNWRKSLQHVWLSYVHITST
eukprot:scaffold97280_cov40-Tisochrysis_lutea.AAC.2